MEAIVKRGDGRPKNGYYNAAKDRLVSSTGVTDLIGNKDGMIYKAKKQWHEAARRGFPFERDAYWADDQELWGTDAKDTGSIVHQWIEDSIHGDPLTRFDDNSAIQLAEATKAYEAFRNWWADTNLEIIATELPLVSEEFQFGGTLDAIAMTGSGHRVLLDWKASNGAYPKFIAQLASYRVLVNENNYGPVEDAYLLRVGKARGDFHFHYYPSDVLDDGWEAFLHAKGLLEFEKLAKKITS